jgi:ApbE superfamily uncharacterized protein (UPF0280 family)
MTGGSQAALLPDGRRLHLQHGPIDIIAEAFGDAEEVRLAYGQAARRFETILGELVTELATLRLPITDAGLVVAGAVAQRMVAAVWPFRQHFVTPMAAVAGAVADEVLDAMLAGRRLASAYVNDGGDIALHLAPGERLRAGLVANPDAPALDERIEIDHAMPVRGLATSGWRGRSFSLGIADAVTVLAATAAAADAAATLVADAVDCDHPAIRRAPAKALRDDTDLGDLLVTVDVGALPARMIDRALASGVRRAAAFRRARLIFAASLVLQGRVRIVGPLRTNQTSMMAGG